MTSRVPAQWTRFIGREREMADLRQRLARTRLLTLTGPAGAGKSRLALEVVRQSGVVERDALTWVDLAPVAGEPLVPKTVAAALGVPEQPGRVVGETLVDFLRAKKLMLVLDNCEHVSAASAELAYSLLQHCPGVHILATSLQPLAVSGEMVYPLSGLSLPAADTVAALGAAESRSADALSRLHSADAIALFLDRAAALVPAFALTPANARSIATICLRLDGLPLAIELAAAWANVLAVDQIAAMLDDRFTLLAAAPRPGVERRHETLRAAIDWSFALLSPAEQRLLARLSIFAAGCSLESAAFVCGDGAPGTGLLPLLSSLVTKSLVVAETRRPGEARYHLLETIRHYAREKLQASQEWPHIRDRLIAFYLQRVEEIEPELQGAYQEHWLNWLAEEYGNVRSALLLPLESGQIEAGLRIAIVFFQFWTIRDYVEEGLQWFEQLLAGADERVSPAVRASALAYASVLAGRRGLAGRQRRHAEEAVRLGEAAGDDGKPALATAFGALAWLAHQAGDHQAAFRLGWKEIELFRELGDPHQLGVTLTIFSFMALSAGRYEEARAVLDEGLPLLRQAGNTYRIAMALNYAGDLARCEQDYGRAEAAYEESLALLRQIGAARDQASVLHNLGHACLQQGNLTRAQKRFAESLALHQEQDNRPGMAECLLGFAAAAIARGQLAAGARLLAALGELQPVTPAWAATYMAYADALAEVRAGLAEAAWRREEAAGRRLSLEQAVAYAQQVARTAAAARKSQAALDELTPREQEVAALVGQGKANDEIAAELVVSKRTVEKHIANIRAKLGFSSRSQMVRWAIQAGLVDAGEA
jgi:predicted ATPase/DNA-binding CsgD family transcriptional regulator